MAQTGKQRSLTVTITKKIAGVIQGGYPVTYQGKNSFTFNSVTYPTIDNNTMATMAIDAYQSRLTAFKLYVESLQLGLDFGIDTVAGGEPYRDNLTSCPIG